MEIADNIHQISLGGDQNASHVYYVGGGERGAFIDASFPDEAKTRPVLEYWSNTLGSPSTGWVLITHRHDEHAGGAQLLKGTTGARVAAGRGDADVIDADFGAGRELVDDRLDGGERFELGGGRQLVAVAAPGHTAGNVCYLLEPDGVLFTGDHIMGSGTVVVRTDEGGSMAEHIESLRKLGDLDVRLILSGHGPPISDVAAKLKELVEYRLRREAQILGLLETGVGDVEALLQLLYRETPERLLDLARHQIVAHLGKLVADGEAIVLREGVSYRRV